MSNFSIWPKVELHRHIEGSMRIETFLDLAHQINLDLPDWTRDGAKKLIQLNEDELKSFSGFLRTFSWLRKVLVTPEAVERVTYEAIEDAAKECVVYLELRFNPGAFFVNGLSEEEIISSIRKAVAQAKKKFGIHAGIIGIIGRDMPLELGNRTMNFCIKYYGNGIDAIDLAGNEIVPPKCFVNMFKRAKEAKIPITIHAGEIAGAENIIDSIRLLGAQRIGHGAHLFESNDAVQCVLDYGVSIETCLTSNVYTGAVRSIELHPLKQMLERKIPVSINTDDPRVCMGLTLADEYQIANQVLGIDVHTIQKIIKNSVKQGFLTDLCKTIQIDFDEKEEL